MFEMTALEKIFKYFFEKNLDPDNISEEDLSIILKRFGRYEFERDPVQSLPKDNSYVYAEDLFIKPNSDIAVVRRPRYRPHYIMHKHDFIEFTYVYNGPCKFVGPNKEQLLLNQGDLLLLASDTEHQIHIDSDDSIVFHISVRCSTFDNAFMRLLDGEDILSQFFSRIIYGLSPITYVLFEVGGDEKVKGLHLEMYNEMQLSHRTSNRMLNIYFEWLCVYLIRTFDCKIWVEDNQQQNIDIMKILKYIRDNYKDITLKEVAQKFNYSKTYLCKIIKKYTGHTYRDLVRDIRMKKACEILKKGQTSMSDIAFILGYKDVSSFYRSFKNTYNLTPAQYQHSIKDDRNK